MAHKKSLEALDRTLKDLRSNNNRFGGAMILLAGDFRQTLPVIPRSTPADELNACLKSSSLWKHVKVLHLSKNMRVELQNDQSGNIFSKQLIDIDELIQKVFPDVSQNYRNHDWLSERAILAAKNIDVNELNFKIQEQITGELMIYKSVDSATNQDDVVNYPPEFLNSLDLPGLPPHNLQLKVGSVVIMLRNINQPRLCNGTRLAIKKLLNNVIEATILKGKYKGEDVLIPRIPMIPTDVPFEFKRLQFPVRLAFAMTINKSQGQSLSVCGINLETHVSHMVNCMLPVPVLENHQIFIYAPGIMYDGLSELADLSLQLQERSLSLSGANKCVLRTIRIFDSMANTFGPRTQEVLNSDLDVLDPNNWPDSIDIQYGDDSVKRLAIKFHLDEKCTIRGFREFKDLKDSSKIPT
ncbi:ATP-dependent DNA helicase PIF1-like [Aphis gossypii]|uniref:ATP-dependent DNA helicase PIF1-like n=1 Tax=Aphis gossypii TaxID=80765 RepID=UPI002158B2DD|nr:ATP-dependent DNA helicase PIF1-like [Aphis gossypii]